jgi:hypothetical protein
LHQRALKVLIERSNVVPDPVPTSLDDEEPVAVNDNTINIVDTDETPPPSNNDDDDEDVIEVDMEPLV